MCHCMFRRCRALLGTGSVRETRRIWGRRGDARALKLVLGVLAPHNLSLQLVDLGLKTQGLIWWTRSAQTEQGAGRLASPECEALHGYAGHRTEAAVERYAEAACTRAERLGQRCESRYTAGEECLAAAPRRVEAFCCPRPVRDVLGAEWCCTWTGRAAA